MKKRIVKCPRCKKEWDSLESFLEDFDVEFIGAEFETEYYNHAAFYCGATLLLTKRKGILDIPLSFENKLFKHKYILITGR